MAQAIAVGEAVDRGLRRFEAAGGDTSRFSPVCSLMIGRLDDWVKVLVERDDVALDPNAANWAGIAVFKRAYGIYQERGYRTRLLAAAYRHRLHWTELVGGDIVLTMPHTWQVRFNGSGIVPQSRIDVPVEPAVVDELLARIPDFERAYEPDGLAIADFAGYGATARTLRSFVQGYHDLQASRPRHRAAQPRRPGRLTAGRIGRLLPRDHDDVRAPAPPPSTRQRGMGG